MLLRQENIVIPTAHGQNPEVYLDSVFAKSNIPVELRLTAESGAQADFDGQQHLSSINYAGFKSKNGTLVFTGAQVVGK